MKRRSFQTSIVVLVFAFAGCSNSSKPPASIHLQWRIGALQTCDDAEVSQVVVQLYKAGRDELVDESTSPCGLLEATIEDVPAGTYDVVVQGLTATTAPGASQPQYRVTYEGLYAHLKVAAGELVNVPEAVILQGKPAELVLLWKFESGFACYNHGVVAVATSVWGENGVPIAIERDDFPCELNELLEEQDGAHFIGGSCGLNGLQGILLTGIPPQTITVEIFGLNDEGQKIYYASARATPGLGEQACVSLLLRACEDSVCL